MKFLSAPRPWLTGLVALLLALATLSSAVAEGQNPGGGPPSLPPAATEAHPAPQVTAHPNVPVCPGPGDPGTARCHARQRTDDVGTPLASGAQSAGTIGNGGAYDPNYLRLAYNLSSISSSAGGGQTVAIVDAYDDPKAENDLGYYRSYFG